MFSLRRLSALALAALLALSSAQNAAFVLAEDAAPASSGSGLDTGAVLGALISSVGSVVPLGALTGGSGNNGTSSSSGTDGIIGSLAGVTAGFLSGDSANTGRALGGTGGVSNVLSSVTGGNGGSGILSSVTGGNGGGSGGILTTATNLMSSFTGGGRKMLRA